MNNNDLAYYTKEDIDAAIKFEYRILTDGVKKGSIKEAYILGGQPGAGKTVIHNILNSKYEKNIISINADEYRIFHPNYEEIRKTYGEDSVNYTGKFSGEVTEKLIDKLSNEGYNLIVEGTLRDKNVPLNTERLLKQKGYVTELSVIVVKPEISYLSTKLRYERMYAIGEYARATPKENHDRVANIIPDNLHAIYISGGFNNITLYDRNQKCIYDKSITSEISPKEIISKVFSRKWTSSEMDNYKNDINEVYKYMCNRNATASEIEAFKNEFIK